jgi:hypothetical protein
MASDLIMNGVTYDGTPSANPTHPRKPTGLTRKEEKIGRVLVAANGARTWVQRVDGSSNPIRKRTWEIAWDKANETTRAALRTLNALATTWTFVDQLGTSYTVQTEAEDYEEEYAMTDSANNLYYRCKLTVREA